MADANNEQKQSYLELTNHGTRDKTSWKDPHIPLLPQTPDTHSPTPNHYIFMVIVVTIITTRGRKWQWVHFEAFIGDFNWSNDFWD